VTARPVLVVLLLAALTALTGCTGGEGSSSTDPSTPSTPSTQSPSSSAAAPSSTAPPTAKPVPAPPVPACYRLGYQEAVAPTNQAAAVGCDTRHTSVTFAVGRLDTVVDGHLLAVDSARVQSQVATTCPERFARFVGGSQEDRRLSMLRAVWFTPTVEASDTGAAWYRCDVIAVAADEKLAPLTGRLAGVLSTEAGQDRYGMCSTAEPGDPDFARVICSSGHSWRAITTVPFPDGPYPGADKVREAGQQPCEDAARQVAADTLSFRWGYEWPTAEQWRAGRHYGLCWAPD